jgi:hypothetical protein
MCNGLHGFSFEMKPHAAQAHLNGKNRARQANPSHDVRRLHPAERLQDG